LHQPSIFHETRPEVLCDLIEGNPFALLATVQQGLPIADHLPLVLSDHADGRMVLQGHLAAVNPIARLTAPPGRALAVFQGAQTYVSPSWYASKAEHGKVVPTWNYVSVHVRGALRLLRDADWILAHLNALTHRHERRLAEPWAVSDAPEDFVHRQLRGIVGIEIDVEDMKGVWKVSQNKPAADAMGVVQGLRRESGHAGTAMANLVADRMGQFLR
jgi:transcriptional regulator